MRLALVPLSLFLIAFSFAHGDDGAASVAAGGVVLMKREPRIVMAKEVLRISESKVQVDYEFRNESNEPITTTVAFPVPAYEFGEKEEVFGNPGFDDFELSVDGRPKTFKTEVQAFIGKRDITKLLERYRIDAASFGHVDVSQGFDSPSPDFQRASSAARKELIAAGAFEDGEPAWSLQKKYYWTQTFPAHQIVHIDHRYSPVLGSENSVLYGLEGESVRHPDADTKNVVQQIKSLCLEPPLQAKLLHLADRHDMSVPFNYVDFILTTANTWKTPIEDFTLIVERPKPDKSIVSKPPAAPRRNETLVSFCWNGPVTQIDPTHFMAHATDFVPTKELRVGFIDVDQVDPDNF